MKFATKTTALLAFAFAILAVATADEDVFGRKMLADTAKCSDVKAKTQYVGKSLKETYISFADVDTADDIPPMCCKMCSSVKGAAKVSIILGRTGATCNCQKADAKIKKCEIKKPSYKATCEGISGSDMGRFGTLKIKK